MGAFSATRWRKRMSFEMILGAWVATGLTLLIFTFLYKDNPLFKLAEHLYVGISIGYTIVKTYDTMGRLIYEPIVQHGEWSLLIPLGIGLLMLARYVPKASWLSRIAFAFVVGVGSGLAIPRVISSYVLKQIEDTVRPLVSMSSDGLTFTASFWNPASNLNAVILLIGVITVLFYFFFSVEHTGPVHVAARTGVMFLMISFGAAFGYTVMARMSLLIGRLSDLKDYSDSQYGWPTLFLGIITIVLLYVWTRRQRSRPAEHPEV
jgi:lipoprotein signal peptidase